MKLFLEFIKYINRNYQDINITVTKYDKYKYIVIIYAPPEYGSKDRVRITRVFSTCNTGGMFEWILTFLRGWN